MRTATGTTKRGRSLAGRAVHVSVVAAALLLCVAAANDTAHAAACAAMPLAGCRPPEPRKSIFLLKNNANDGRDKLLWKWQNQGPQATPFGDPTTTTNYTLCMYAGSAAASVAIPAGPNWHALGGAQFIFADPSGSPDGAQKAKLKGGSGAPGVIPKALVKAKGSNLPDLLAPPLPLPVIVQMVNDTNATCFSAFYDTDGVIKNDTKQFKGRAISLFALP